MQRKVKKGCGRVRNMPVKDLNHLVTKYNKCHYITAGKLYRIVEGRLVSMNYVVADNGGKITAPVVRTSAHLGDFGRWEHPFK